MMKEISYKEIKEMDNVFYVNPFSAHENLVYGLEPCGFYRKNVGFPYTKREIPVYKIGNIFLAEDIVPGARNITELVCKYDLLADNALFRGELGKLEGIREKFAAAVLA